MTAHAYVFILSLSISVCCFFCGGGNGGVSGSSSSNVSSGSGGSISCDYSSIIFIKAALYASEVLEHLIGNR